jgi:predicted GTPase
MVFIFRDKLRGLSPMSEEKPISSSIDKAKAYLSSLFEKLESVRGKKFVFLLVGRTGVGKSSTINSLMGKPIAQVGHYEPTTMGVESYESEINGIDFIVIDTPGLCDEIEEEGNDEKYLERMRSKAPKIDSMWFVSRLDETRVTADEKRGIKLISNAFGYKVWEHAVIVFTYANSVGETRYQEALEKRTELIKK